jgi:hypothetical protein
VWDQHWVDKVDPNVVVLLAGRWEVVTRTWHGQWTNITDPAFAAYVKSQLEFTVKLLGSTGARVVLMTAPCYDSGDQPNGTPWPEDSPKRLATYNDLLSEVAAENPNTVSVFNLDALVCPGGQYQEFIGDVQVRQSDGVHFTITGGKYLGPYIWPTLVKLGREQMAARAKSATTTTGAP